MQNSYTHYHYKFGSHNLNHYQLVVLVMSPLSVMNSQYLPNWGTKNVRLSLLATQNGENNYMCSYMAT